MPRYQLNTLTRSKKISVSCGEVLDEVDEVDGGYGGPTWRRLQMEPFVKVGM